MYLTRRSSIRAALICSLFVVAAAKSASAQITTDTTHWNDADLYTEPVTAPSFFAVGGGILGAYFKPNLGDFNTFVAQPFTKQTIAERVWMLGGQGFVSVPWVKNLRVGGMGYSGTSDCGCTDTLVAGTETMNRYLTYSVGYGALTVDYVLPLRTGRFHIVPGVALGLGSVNIYARQATNRVQFDITEFDQPNLQTTHTYTSKFFLYMPQLQFEYAPLGYMMFRLTAAYQGTAMGTWTVDQGLALGNADHLSNVTGNGLVASLGVFFGLFQ